MLNWICSGVYSQSRHKFRMHLLVDLFTSVLKKNGKIEVYLTTERLQNIDEKGNMGLAYS